MTTSTHKVEVVPIKLEKHPNADSLSIIPIFGYQAVGRTDDWKDKTLGAWIPPDTLVPIDRPEFSFLKQGTSKFYDAESRRANETGGLPLYYRVTVKRFRGTLSYGLLVPAPEGCAVGYDVADVLGVKHYDPPVHFQNQGPSGLQMGGEVAKGPTLYSPKYDVDSFQRYAKLVFVEGESIICTEKIHGASGRWVYHNGEYHCGSRTEWKKEYPSYEHVSVDDIYERLKKKNGRLLVTTADTLIETDEQIRQRAEEIVAKVQNKPKQRNMWWKALDKYPVMKEWLKLHEGLIVYGEVYGSVQDMKYGHGQGEVSIAVFDIMRESKWLDSVVAIFIGHHLPWVPLVTGKAGHISYNFDTVVKMAEGQSLIPGAGHIREGCVVKPLVERTHPDIGRVQLKCINPSYLEK